VNNEEKNLYFNGINGASGDYWLPPLSPQDVASVALGERPSDAYLRELRNRYEQREAHFGIQADQTNLAETGWGVIFAAKDTRAPAIREALKPLLKLRREQATQKDERYYQEYLGAAGYRPGDSYLDFLGRDPRNMGPGPANPAKVPYYLLIVGDPEAIPYRFQYQLDVQYAVGRIYFDTLEEYAQYAASVVATETGDRLRLPRQVRFFGVHNQDDPATELSAQEMIRPLAEAMAEKRPEWDIQRVDQATKARLATLVGGAETPALLFTASHGMGFPKGDPRQLRHQGALLCEDWPGPRRWREPIPEDFYFSVDDVGSDARLAGMMAFFFACYGAGTPRQDQFAHRALGQPAEIAPHAFIARLPQRLLAHPKGGALAVVGHVERAWGYSFMWSGSGRQLEVFRATLDQLLDGYPVGAAIEWFNERHAELSVVLTNEIEEINEYGKQRDDVKLAGMWTANNDARGYVILGDPAARLPVAEDDEPTTERPTITIGETTRAHLAAAEDETPTPAAEIASPSTLPAREAVEAQDYAMAFGLQDQFAGLTKSLRTFTDQLAKALGEAAEKIATLEVQTYTSDDLPALAKGADAAKTLRALTRIEFDGDIQVYVPEKATGGVDETLWRIHADMVKEAQLNRAQFLEAMAEMATNLLKSLKPV